MNHTAKTFCILHFAFCIAASTAGAAEIAKFIEYVETDGNGNTKGEYVLLDYVPTSNSVVEAEIAVRDITKTHAIFCARGSAAATDTFTLFHIGNQGFRWDYNRTTGEYQGGIANDAKIHVRCTKEGFWLNGTKSSTIQVSPLNYVPANRMMLFACYTCDPAATPAPPSSGINYAKIRLYSFKAWDDDGATLRVDLRPCVDVNGAGALYDNVSGNLYYSLSSKKLIASADKDGYDKTFYVSTNDLHVVDGVLWGTYVTDDGLAHKAYTNLQQVINTVAGGSTIWIEDGFVVSKGSRVYDNNVTRIVSSGWNSKLTIRSRSGDWRTGAEIRGDEHTRCLGGQSDNYIGIRFVSGTTTNGNGGGVSIGAYGGVFENCLFADCTGRGNGGGISGGKATLRNCLITNCVSKTGSGGGVDSASCYDCVFIGNRASGTAWRSGDGGGIYQTPDSHSAIVSNCVFVDCHAYNKAQIGHASRQAGAGGAIYGCLSARDCTISNCTASASGGGIANCNGGSNVTVVNCQSGRGGGGIWRGDWRGGAIIGCSDTNTAHSTTTNGGGASDKTILTDFLISGNYSPRYGGGANSCTLTNCVVVFNVASNKSASSSAIIAGGGIYGGRAVGCVIANNIACGPVSQKGNNYYGIGGGANSATLIRCLVTNNVSWYRGGGVYAGSAMNCFVADNEAFAEGGGFAGSSSIFNTLVARNTATKQAGVWTDSKATTVLVNSTVTANENTVASQSAVYRAAITNSVVWGNLGEGVSQTASRIGAANSCYPEANGANGTTSRNPNLADVEGKTFVATASCCRRKGVLYDWMNNGTVRSTDWYGAPRVYQDRPDMGWVSVLPPPRCSVIYIQ